MTTKVRGWFRQGSEPVGCGFLGAGELGRWLEGTLAPVRLEAFDLHRNSGCGACALLAADAESFRYVVERGPLASELREWNGVAAIQAAELRQMLERRATERAPVPGWSWTRLAGLAAAAVLAIAVVVPFVVDGTDPGRFGLPNGSTYAARTLPYSAPVEIRSEGDGLAAAWRSAGDAYQAGDWAEAARTFATIAAADPTSRDAALYGGIALVMAGEYEQAQAPLHDALRLGQDIGASPAVAEYYLGLAALGRDDVGGARTALERAAADGGPFGAEARALLEQLAAN